METNFKYFDAKKNRTIDITINIHKKARTFTYATHKTQDISRKYQTI